MYKNITDENIESAGNPPENISLWLTEETIRCLKTDICPTDQQNVIKILYRDFLKWRRLNSVEA